jgi:hypothetical protein
MTKNSKKFSKNRKFKVCIQSSFSKSEFLAPKNKNTLLVVVQIAESNFVIYFL